MLKIDSKNAEKLKRVNSKVSDRLMKNNLFSRYNFCNAQKFIPRLCFHVETILLTAENENKNEKMRQLLSHNSLSVEANVQRQRQSA